MSRVAKKKRAADLARKRELARERQAARRRREGRGIGGVAAVPVAKGIEAWLFEQGLIGAHQADDRRAIGEALGRVIETVRHRKC